MHAPVAAPFIMTYVCAVSGMKAGLCLYNYTADCTYFIKVTTTILHVLVNQLKNSASKYNIFSERESSPSGSHGMSGTAHAHGWFSMSRQLVPLCSLNHPSSPQVVPKEFLPTQNFIPVVPSTPHPVMLTTWVVELYCLSSVIIPLL